MTTLKEFIENNNIRLIVAHTNTNPNMFDSKNMDNWECEIIYHGRSFYTYFSKGKGHKGAVPTIYEVLECMNQDIYSVEGYTVCDFIEEFGYNCREGHHVYKAIQKQICKLKELFQDKYEEFVSIDTNEYE